MKIEVKDKNSLNKKDVVEGIEVIDENLDKIEVLIVKRFSENYIAKQPIDDETFDGAQDEEDVKDEYVTDFVDKKVKNEVKRD